MSSKQILMPGIPVASPYYDRLRSLNIELDFVPYNSPEYHHLKKQIEELEYRALRRMDLAPVINKKEESV